MKGILVAILGALLAASLGISARGMADEPGRSRTRTPIHHLIVVIGENHSFDNIFATYVPPDPSQHVWNLLSEGIVDKSGAPGPNAFLAQQQQASDTEAFELSPMETGAFLHLPQPNTTLNALPASPCALSKISLLNPSGVLFCTDESLPADAQDLLSEGGTGQSFYAIYGTSVLYYPAPDCRYPGDLANAPYSLVDASVLNDCPEPFLSLKEKITPTQYGDNVGDPVHRFFQMWQQNDCSASRSSRADPSGCLHDLYVWVATTMGWGVTNDDKNAKSNPPPVGLQDTFQGGIPMGFYNMANGDYPYFKWLADHYTINDNYHQFIMGGTGPNSQSMMTADVYYYTDENGNAATPPDNLIENPDPQPGTNNYYQQDRPWYQDLGSTSAGGLVDCSDLTQPGVAAIRDYLDALRYRLFNKGNCAPGHYYQVDNEYPSYDHLGQPVQQDDEFPAGPDYAIGPQTIPTIGDALSARSISWKYYAGGLKFVGQKPLANSLYCAICNGFQYSRSIMTGPLRSNMGDIGAFFDDVKNNTLPAVAYVKPDVLVDSHPGTSTPPLFEAFVRNVIETVQSNPGLWQSTAILITFDESGGYYDSGYIEPIDFFGDGPRTVMIAVSPFARTGYVDHTYSDHASILKFIERNWRLRPLSRRSRDNLRNPKARREAPYVPVNAPAIGNLMGMFDFEARHR